MALNGKPSAITTPAVWHLHLRHALRDTLAIPVLRESRSAVFAKDPPAEVAIRMLCCQLPRQRLRTRSLVG